MQMKIINIQQGFGRKITDKRILKMDGFPSWWTLLG